MLRAGDISGVHAIIPTPATAAADQWSAVDTVDLAEAERLTRALVDDGVDGLIITGTTGEAATLTDDEWKSFVDCVLSTVGGRIPTFVGATTMGMHQTVERLRFISERGAEGTMLGLPMWQPCTEDMGVRFYETISEAFPDLSIMVYMNTGAFRFDFSVPFWQRVVDAAPTVQSAKWTRTTPFDECVAATGGRINFLPIDMSSAPVAKADPDHVTAIWSTAASMGPAPSLALMDAIDARDWGAVDAVSADIAWACETFLPPDPQEFGLYNIQIEKIRMNASEYCNAGPLRPPYDLLPPEMIERAQECGRRWTELQKKYAARRVGQRDSRGA